MIKDRPSRLVLHREDGSRQLLDPDEIYWLEADGDDTWVRLRGARRIRDTRPLGELEQRLVALGFVRVHRSHMVNLNRTAVVRRRRGSRGWEVKLVPPVNRVLPVSEEGLRTLWQILDEHEPT